MSGFAVECNKNYSAVRFDAELRDMEWGDVEKNTAEVINSLEASHTTKLLIDLSPMEMIHSGLVAALVRIWKCVKGPGSGVVVVSPNTVVAEVLKAAGLQKLFQVVETCEEAAYILGVSKVALVEQRERRVIAWVALPSAILAIAAVAFLYMGLSPFANLNFEVAAALLATFASVTGVLSVVRDAGGRRVIGLLAVVAGIVVLTMLWIRRNPDHVPWKSEPDRSSFEEEGGESGDEASSGEDLSDRVLHQRHERTQELAGQSSGRESAAEKFEQDVSSDSQSAGNGATVSPSTESEPADREQTEPADDSTPAAEPEAVKPGEPEADAGADEGESIDTSGKSDSTSGIERRSDAGLYVLGPGASG
jgi:anti-anti-sigma factor